MGSKSQRRKERHERKRLEKRKKSRAREQQVQRSGGIPLPSNLRHRQRLAQQVPCAWPGETPEDVAVFDDAVLATLPREVADQIAAVREALQHASESRGDDALKATSEIPRGSPLSEWRLFIRGLVSWLADDAQAVNESWQRLSSDRRPGRVATAMMVALRSDLENVSHASGKSSEQSPSQSRWNQWDDQLLYHAKLLRRVRFDRAAIRIADTALRTPEESPEMRLGPEKIQWLRQFSTEYRDTEPDLVAALSQVALGRAFAQVFSNLFEDAAKFFPGPRHDRRNRLLTFFYFSNFDDRVAEKKANAALKEYLKNDLPENKDISPPLRDAIASQIHLNEALMLLQPARGGGIMDMLLGPPQNPKEIQDHLRAAVNICPANRQAQKAYVEWLQSILEGGELTKPQQKPLENELAAVMRSWAKGLPDDVEPRLWLVDHLLENEQLDEAKPHVDALAASRQDDPRVRATPWKWQLLDAMRLCRRKAWLSQVPARLDEAERLWPAWLSAQWLPYLRAAWTLRGGRTEAYEQERRRICEQSGLAQNSLGDACMMLAAAQQMRASADELKPLRAVVDQAAKRAADLRLDEILDAAGFFWDLHRAQLVYPAYRMHGAKIGKELLARVNKTPKLVLDAPDDERIQRAVLWCSEYQFWPLNYEKWPSFYKNRAIERHPMFAAAKLNAAVKGRFIYEAAEYRKLAEFVREAAPSQRDAYYRHWFVALTDELEEVLEKNASRFFGPFGNPFGPLGADSDDDDFDEDGDVILDSDPDFDPDCNCPACQRAKRAHKKSRPSGGEIPF